MPAQKSVGILSVATNLSIQ